MDDGTFTTYTTKEGLSSDEVHALCADRGGNLWVGTGGGGLTRLKDGAVAATYTSRDGLPGDFVRALVEDGRGNLWIGTNGGGLARLRDGALKAYGTREGLPSDLVFALAEDPEGSLWLGTNGGGLARLRPRAFTSFSTKQGLSHDVVLPIYEDRAGSVWVGTAGGGLNRLRDGSVTRYTTRDGLPANLILSLAEDSQGRLWVGTLGGLARRDGSSFKAFTTRDGLTQNAALALLAGRDGSLWIGTNGGGLNRFADGRFTAYTRKDGLADDSVWCLLEDAGDTLWVGTSGGLSRLERGRITTYTTRDGLPGDEVMTLHADAEGALWIGTSGGGLGRLKDGRFAAITTKEGLFDDGVWRILEDGEGYLWMSSNKGVFRVRKRDLDDLAEGKRQRIVSLAYGKSDGLDSPECNGGVSPAGWRTRDGRLWFPTLKGIAVVDPRRVPINALPPPVVVEDVVVDDEALDARRPAHLAPGRRHLEFRYTALSFVAPEKVRFRYLLEGFDPAWIEAGDRRTGHYTSLPPGRYRFRVIAANNDGVWNESGASFAFEVEPYFHQTYWFYALCLLLAGALGAGLYRFHTERVRERELEALVEERTGDLQRAKQRAEEALIEAEGAKEALTRSEAKFRSLIQNSSDIVMVVDDRASVIYASPAAGAVLHHATESLLGGALLDLVHPEDVSAVRAALDTAAPGRPAAPFRFRIRHRDGSWRLLEAVTANLIGDPAVGGVVLNARDLTDQKVLEDQLRQAQKMEAVGRLAGGIAHDFNNLLGVITGYSELLLKDVGADHPARKRLEQIRKAADRASGLTRQLLAFSRKQLQRLEVLDLNVIVGDIGKMLRRVIGEDIQLATVLGPQLGRVRADPGQVEQILMNLVVNARDAMPTGGRLTIETDNTRLDQAFAETHRGAVPGPHVVLAVTDTGHGMNEDTLSHIFEPFFTTKGEGKGTGLGLATVYGIVKQSGGYVDVSSALGRGTTFRVYLPRVDDSRAVVSGPVATSLAAPPGGSETILLVEDDDPLRSLISEIVSEAGYCVLEAASPEHAVELARSHADPLHLLLTDVIMPGMSGRKVAEAVCSARAGTKVLYMSGYTAEVLGRHRILDPGTHLLEKPFTSEMVLRKLREVLDAGQRSAEVTTEPIRERS